MPNPTLVTGGFIGTEEQRVRSRAGPRLNTKAVFPCMGISIIKIRDRLIFIMGISVLVNQHL